MPLLPLLVSWFRSLVPARRRAGSWKAVWTLAIWAALYGGLIFALEVGGVIRFSWKPAFFLLLAAPWVWWLHETGWSGLGGWRAHVALHTRLWLLGVLVATLAEPRAVRRSEALSLIYALDVSDSMGEKVSDRSIEWMLTTKDRKQEKDEVGLVVFGREAAVELPPRPTFPFEGIASQVARDGSDLAKALSLSSAMLPEGNQGRIVLVSDGNETDGHVLPMLDQLKARGIQVDVLPVGFNFEKEVWLERLDVPRVVKRGETYEAAILLSALQPGKGKLRLAENGEVIAEREVEYTAGKNRFTLPLPMRTPGYYSYVASVELAPGEDAWTENNTAMADLFLKGEGRVLVITDVRGDARDWESLVQALKQSERIVDVRMGYQTPREALALMSYDLIVIPNAPADTFDAVQLQALHDAVFQQGSGLIMLGSRETFGPGGYHRTPIEDALPVSMDVRQKKVMPKGALALILHTCEIPAGNTWAKEIAKAAVRVLSGEDEVGLLDYVNGRDRWEFPLTAARLYDSKLLPLINAAVPEDMPAFDGVMRMALQALQNSDAATRHVVIISDGDPSPPRPELLAQYSAAKITVSTVAVNPHGGQTVDLMEAIATQTNGRFYYPKDPNELPSIFIKEAKTLKRSMIQERREGFTPGVEFPSPILRGIEAMPKLYGYVLTTPKPKASVVLNVPPDAMQAAQGEAPDPLLAVWRYGLGTTAAWTSDFAPNWARDWTEWEKYRALIRQLVTEVSRVETRSDFSLGASAQAGQGVIVVEDFAPAATLMDIKARVLGPQGKSVDLMLRQVAPRRYRGEFPLWGKGRYQVAAAGLSVDPAAGAKGKARVDQAVGGFSVAYSPEYLRFQSDPILLRQIAERTGGRVLSKTDMDLFQFARQGRESSKPVFDWFLVALACLIPLDVAIRRVQLDWQVIGLWFGLGRMQEATVTTGALLERKKQGQRPTPATNPETERPQPLPTAVIAPRSPKVDTPPTKPAPSANPADAPPKGTGTPQTTMERLLARKRQKQDGDKPEDGK